MKERPILFNDDMVRAIRDGRKTQTRRVARGLPTLGDSGVPFKYHTPQGKERWGYRAGQLSELVGVRCPYGQPGDRLWVREAHSVRDGGVVWYRAAGLGSDWDGEIRWTPSIHMPRWASRITLEITDVRVERLQDIDEGSCWDEGVEAWMEHDENLPRYSDGTPNKYNNIRQAFAAMWDSINGRGSWDANPWVWVVEFPRSHP